MNIYSPTLIGNNDAHAKYISFLVNTRGISLAPFYDPLCVQVYLTDSNMAMSIDGELKPGWIEKSHWTTLAQQASLPVRTFLMNHYIVNTPYRRIFLHFHG